MCGKGDRKEMEETKNPSAAAQRRSGAADRHSEAESCQKPGGVRGEFLRKTEAPVHRGLQAPGLLHLPQLHAGHRTVREAPDMAQLAQLAQLSGLLQSTPSRSFQKKRKIPRPEPCMQLFVSVSLLPGGALYA